MTDLPNGWEWVTLEELGVGAQPGFASGKHNRDKRGITHLRPMNVSRLGLIDTSDVRYVVDDSTRRVQADDVLFNNTNSPALVGKTALVTSRTPLAYSNHMTRLRPSKGVVSAFLARQLHWLWTRGYFRDVLSHHVNQASVSSQVLLQTRIAIPGTAEQRRVVAALERYLPRAQSAATSLRAACMKIDFLVGSARQELTMMFADGMQPLGNLLIDIEAGRSFVAEGRPAEVDEWGIIKVSAMTWGEFRQDENKAVPCDREIDVRHEIKTGDILISRANTEKYVGAAVLVRGTRPKLLLSDKSLRLIPKQSVDPVWLTEVLASPAVRSQISARATGMKDSMRNISQKALREIRVPSATSKQQAQVVEALSDLRIETSRLRSQVEAAERRQDLLRESLLRDAFAGRLVSQDSNDEPASVLLERIKAERTARPKARRGRLSTKRTNPVQEGML